MEEDGTSSLLGCETGTRRDRRNVLRMGALQLIWGVSYVAATWLGVDRDLLPGEWLRWLVAAVPTLIGVAALLAFRRYLLQADEFQRAIQLHGLALGFGGGWLAITGYQLFEQQGAPDDVPIVVTMVLFYVIGVLVGRWRYR